MELVVVERRSLMKRRKSLGDRTEPCGTPLLIIKDGDECPSTQTTIDRFDKKEVIDLNILGVNPIDGSLAISCLCHTLLKAFEISRAMATDSPYSLRDVAQVCETYARRSPHERDALKPYWWSESK